MPHYSRPRPPAFVRVAPPLAGYVARRAQRTGAASGLPLFTSCADVNAYMATLDNSIQSYNSDILSSNVAADSDFFTRWKAYLKSWQDFSRQECVWYATYMADMIDGLHAYYDALVSFEKEGVVQPSSGSVPATAPEGPTFPGSTTDVGSVIKTVAIAAAIIVGGVVLWKVFDMVGD